MGGSPAASADRRTIVIEGTTPRFAVPECVPRAGDEASRGLPDRHPGPAQRPEVRGPLRVRSREQLMAAIPRSTPTRRTSWTGRASGPTILVVTRAEVGPPKADAASSKGDLTVEVHVYFVDTGKTMLAKRYSGRADNPRVFAHQASDDIMALTQYRGVARTQDRVRLRPRRHAERRAKELYIVDYDGYNPRRVTVNSSLNILPAWSPDGRRSPTSPTAGARPPSSSPRSSRAKNPNLTGERPGARSCRRPPSAPTASASPTPATARATWRSGWPTPTAAARRRLTTTPASTPRPAGAPPARRSPSPPTAAGTPQIYVMDAEGLNVRRLTTVGNWNDAPAWNPSKQYSEIAYTSRLEGGGSRSRSWTSRRARCARSRRAAGAASTRRGRPTAATSSSPAAAAAQWQISESRTATAAASQALAAGPGNNVQPDWGP